MNNYKCKIRVVREIGMIVRAENKNEAEEEAKMLYENEWGLQLPLSEHAEVIEAEPTPRKSIVPGYFDFD